jgi:hypothetical protein
MEKTVLPEEMDGRRVRSKEEIAEMVPPEEGAHYQYSIGIDPSGGRKDPVGLAVLLVTYKGDEVFCATKYLKRLQPGLFSDAVKKIHRLYNSLKASSIQKGGTFDADLWVDGTGVGLPVVQSLQQEIPEASIFPVIITGGYNSRFDAATRTYYISKQTLVSTLLSKLQTQHLRIAKRSREFDTVVSELQNFGMKVTDSMNEVYSGMGTSHDDLAVALMLACTGSDLVGGPIQLW